MKGKNINKLEGRASDVALTKKGQGKKGHETRWGSRFMLFSCTTLY